MAIVKNGLVVENIWYPLLGRDPSEIDLTTPLLVSTSEFAAHRVALARFPRLGLTLEPADDVRDIAWALDHLELVIVNFPKFNDGRGFSQARLLRDAHGFTEEIRATGHILPDQFGFLRRSGVNAVDCLDRNLAEAWAKIWDIEGARFPGHYQPAFGATSNRSIQGGASGGLRRWARTSIASGHMVKPAAGGIAPHEPSWAGAWGY
jgi:uncharacterized protein (DUF934 family)